MSNEHGSKWIRKGKRRAIYMRDGWRCAYCAAEPMASRVFRLTLDHILPRALGGTNEASNLVTACRDCNRDKQDKTLRAWFVDLRWRGVDTKKIGARIRRLVRRPLVSA